MSYVRTDSGLNVIEYPYSREQFQQDHPNVSLPNMPTQAQWAEFDVYSVRVLPQPAFDTQTHTCNSDAVPQLIDGEWVIGWTVSQKSQEDIDADLYNWRQAASCSPFQGRLALANAGLLSTVETVIAASDEKTRVAWEYALVWERMSPMIIGLMSALNINDADADDLFKSAQSIKA